MKAMVLTDVGSPLQSRQLPTPAPSAGQLLIQVHACGVCRTDLHIYEGDLSRPKLPLVLGHEIVGTVAALGKDVEGFTVGQRVGVPWLGHTCGTCRFCRSGRENLCTDPEFTGYTLDGGFAEFTVVDHRFCFDLPDAYSDTAVAPFLCAGLIGYRALRMAGDAHRLGLYGFGAAAHIVAQFAAHQGRDVYAFTQPKDEKKQAFARALGAKWAGGSDVSPPDPLEAALIFAPVGPLVPKALSVLERGGVVVCAGIHMSPIPAFDYGLLWGERRIVSVANLTRQDGVEFFQKIEKIPVRTQVETFPMDAADEALHRLRDGQVQGAAVLHMKHGATS